ncbi:DUF3379 domain-containing protein [Oceanisphaera arctica]|uniref:DUF3379 domain-containing protein n=1 Tax=Oceanisphaera arctica TaxID=641510 RepID=A0A2P5TR06_9GAMM|nr:DUF3379 domain-containing protein [Oceanisphaera arctica]PPL18246.1 hypothetical protein UN63_01675 [Oceanisphaera arctica]GHA12495.1 hypothetical protein GCM10007082_11830 [Oceanisphaera arctica]
MDDLEFRRRAYADPNDKSSDFISASTTNAGNRQFMGEIKDFNHKLARALHEPVPDTLPDKLMLSHLLRQPDKREGFGWRHLAMAASVTFALGFSTRFMHFSAEAEPLPPSIGQVAMSHVQWEMPFTQYVDEAVSLSTINAKLEPYGTRINDMADVGKVYYANHCMFAGGPAAHLVIQGEHDRVHVFIVPADRALQLVNSFSDDHYHGEVIPMTLNRLVVVSELEEDVGKMASKIKASLERAI